MVEYLLKLLLNEMGDLLWVAHFFEFYGIELSTQPCT